MPAQLGKPLGVLPQAVARARSLPCFTPVRRARAVQRLRPSSSSVNGSSAEHGSAASPRVPPQPASPPERLAKDLLSAGENVVERFLKMRRRLGEFAAHLIDVFLVALLDLFAEELQLRVPSPAFVAALQKYTTEIGIALRAQPPGFRVRVVREEWIDRRARRRWNRQARQRRRFGRGRLLPSSAAPRMVEQQRWRPDVEPATAVATSAETTPSMERHSEQPAELADAGPAFRSTAREGGQTRRRRRSRRQASRRRRGSTCWSTRAASRGQAIATRSGVGCAGWAGGDLRRCSRGGRRRRAQCLARCACSR